MDRTALEGKSLTVRSFEVTIDQVSKMTDLQSVRHVVVNSNVRRPARLPQLAFWVLLTFYFFSVGWFTRPHGVGDDLDVIRSVERMIIARSGKQFWNELWDQHNEHRIVTTKLIFLADRLVTGDYQFKPLALLGNVSVVGVFFILRAQLPKHRLNKFAVIVLTCGLFSYSSASSMIWPMAAIGNYLVILLALGMITTLLSSRSCDPSSYRSTSINLLAFFLAVIAVLTQGNGLLTPLIGCMMLYFHRRYISCALWLTGSIVLMIWYFAGYRSTGHTEPLDAIQSPLQFMIYIAAFIGSAFGTGEISNYPAAAILVAGFAAVCGGVLITVATSALFKTKYVFDSFHFWLLCFVLLSAVLTAASRLSYGLPSACASRYHIYSVLFGIATMSLLLDVENSRGKLGFESAVWLPRVALLSVLYVPVTFMLLLALNYSPWYNGGR